MEHSKPVVEEGGLFVVGLGVVGDLLVVTELESVVDGVMGLLELVSVEDAVLMGKEPVAKPDAPGRDADAGAVRGHVSPLRGCRKLRFSRKAMSSTSLRVLAVFHSRLMVYCH